MGKKSLMGATVAHLLKELSPNIPEGEEPNVENEVTNRLRTILGENWATLPVTGPYMMITVLILNYILLPMGVTPVIVADKAISKSKEYGIDTRFEDLLYSAKATAHATGEFTSEKVKELTEYSEVKGREVGTLLRDILNSSQKLGKSVLDKGKSVSKNVFGSLKEKINGEEAEDEESH